MKSSSKTIHLSKTQLDYLLSALAIKERAEKIFQLSVAEQTHFKINLAQMPALADLVIENTQKNYPDLKIPLHSRLEHFVIQNENRLNELICSMNLLKQVTVKIDLIVISVLLDAGAGPQWRYYDEHSGCYFNRSEGLALASLELFKQGIFSIDPKHPYQVDAEALLNLSLAQLEQGFQVSSNNRLVGLANRLQILQRLGKVLKENSQIFTGGRPSGLYHFLIQQGDQQITASFLLYILLFYLGDIWPSQIQVQYSLPEQSHQYNLGDVWFYQPLYQQTANEFAALIPLHKLSLWLTFSLIPPLQEAGILITDIDYLPGLAEYRNGGLFLDSGVLILSEQNLNSKVYAVDDPLVIELRCLTIALLERLRLIINEKLVTELSMAQVLQGGTWQVGRKLAQQLRNGLPPLQIETNGIF